MTAEGKRRTEEVLLGNGGMLGLVTMDEPALIAHGRVTGLLEHDIEEMVTESDATLRVAVPRWALATVRSKLEPQQRWKA